MYPMQTVETYFVEMNYESIKHSNIIYEHILF